MTTSIFLGVNIDHVATLRQSRGSIYPDPVHAALLVEEAGADSVTLHLREDRRHVQERDVRILNESLQTKMNLEMAVTDEMLLIAEKYRPQDCCLVPEKRQELTTEGGLDVVGQFAKIRSACERLHQSEISVSLFIDADLKQIDAAHQAGAKIIEIHTGHYAEAKGKAQQQQLKLIIDAVEHAKQLGLQVNAGHGLHYHNVQQIAAIKTISELNIGHSIIARAVFCGLKPAVQEMKQLMLQARLHSAI